MTNEQKNLIDSLRQQASSLYDKMDEKEVDYDKFKQIADASLLKADQAQKIYDRLYKTFIYYPTFVKNLAKIKDDARVVSDADQKTLKEKYSTFSSYREEYDNVIAKINTNLLVINAEDLAHDIQDVVNEKDSLTYSYELVDAADAYAREKEQALLYKDIVTGKEACVDKNGKQIDMSICRPSSVGSGLGGATYTPSIQDIINRKVEDWINVINVATKSNDLNDVINADKSTSQDVEVRQQAIADAKKAQEDKIAAEKAAYEKQIAEQEAKIQAEKDAQAKKEEELKAIVNSFSFNVDASRITKDKELLEKTSISPRQQNINYALCSAKATKVLNENYVAIGTSQSSIYFTSIYINNTISITVYPNSNISNYPLEIGKKIKIKKTDTIYMLGTIKNVINYGSFSSVQILISDVRGTDGVYAGFDIQILDSVQETTKYIINNPNTPYANGMDWDVYSKTIDATNDEISIARASCPTSDISSEYYKSSSTTKGFDGTNTSKNNLTPLYVLLGGASLFFILKYALKKNK